MSDAPKGRKPKSEKVERTAPCDACGAAVKLRRPSLSGAHFCIRKDCQAAKQRFYQRRRADEAARLEEMNQQLQVDFLTAILSRVASGERSQCQACGREDAVDGIAHPTPDLAGACRALVKTSAPEGLGPRVIFAIWPEAKAAHEARA